MSTQSILDELLEIACGSRPGEMPMLLERLLGKESASQDVLADEARRAIGILRLHAKSMEQMPLAKLEDREAARLGLREWIESTKSRAAELRKEADEFEQTAVGAGLLKEDEVQTTTGRGLLRGFDVSDQEIEAAKSAVFRDGP